MKHLYKIISIMLIVAFIFSFAGCKPQDIVFDTSSIVSNVDNSSEITSTEDISSTEGTSSDEDETSSEDEILSNISSNTSSEPTSSDNSTSSKPSGNTSSTVSNPQTNTSSETKPLTWKEKYESFGCVVLYDENVKLYYYEDSSGYIYESKYDGVNERRGKSYSNWDSTLKLYYEIVEGKKMSYYNKNTGKRVDITGHKLWDDKYYNGYWKIDYKLYTDGTVVFLKDYEYEEDTSVPTCKECGKALGNGTNGTCNYRDTLNNTRILLKCKICSSQFWSETCHSCPEKYKSELKRDACFEIV